MSAMLGTPIVVFSRGFRLIFTRGWALFWRAWCAFCAILRAPRNVICGAWGMLPCEFPYRVQANAASHQDVPAHDAVRRLTHGSQIPFEMQRHTVP